LFPTIGLCDVRPSSSTEILPPLPILQSRLFPSSQQQTQRTKSVKEPSSSSSSMLYHYHTSPSPINSTTYAPSSMTPFRPMRSFHFHRPSIDHQPTGMDDSRSVPLPLDSEKRISQNYTLVTTRSRPSTREGPQQRQRRQHIIIIDPFRDLGAASNVHHPLQFQRLLRLFRGPLG